MALDHRGALAQTARMSRSAFASRFKTLVSKSPARYLLECRMERACEMLAENQYGVKQIASRVGYTTGAAFSNAFKRWSGQSPGEYRRLRFKDAALTEHGQGGP